MKKILFSLLAFVWCINTSSAQFISFTPDTSNGCAPLTVNFTNNSTDTAGVSFIWTSRNTDGAFEKDTFATTYHSSYNFKTRGYYEIALIANDSLGFYIGTEWAYIYVNGSAGYFDISADTVCPTDEIWVMYNSEHKQAVWDFGDGPIDTSWWGDVYHTYSNQGIYNITLYLETNCGWDTIIQSVVVDSSAKPNVEVISYNSKLCPGDSTRVYSPLLNQGNFLNYLWELGNGNFSTEQEPMVAFSDTGIYYVKLSVTNLCGNTATDSVMITVTDSVNEFYVWANGSENVCPGENVSFYASVSGGYNSLTWYFEGGDTAYGQEATHAFLDTGTFYSTVVAENGCGDIVTDTTWVTISIDTLDKPNAGFDYPDTICPGEKAYFWSWDWGVQYEWDFGNGATSNLQYPEVIYKNTGIYNVKLTVTNACGISNTEINTIFVGSSGNETIFVQMGYNSDSICPGGVVNFWIDTTQNTWDIEWNFDDGSTLTTDWEVNHYFDIAGIYNVTLIGSGSCGNSDTDWVDIYVGNNAPVSGVEIAHFPDSACANDTIFFMDFGLFQNGFDSLVTNTYTFDFGDGNTAVSNSLFNIFFLAGHVYATNGTYNVSVQVENECGGTAVFYDTVKISSGSYPYAFFITNDFEFEEDTLYKCPGDSIYFFGYGGLTYSWDFGDGNKSAEKNISHLYQSTGYFEASLVVTNGCGLTDTTSLVININSSNVPDININYNNTSICEGEPLWLDSWGSGYTELVWDFGDGTFSYENNFEKLYDNAGDYVITLTASNSCGSSTDTIVVEVFERAIAAFTASPTILSNVKDTVFFENFSQNAVEYIWDFGDGKGYSYDKNPYYVYGDSGVYEVELLATNFADCNDETYSFIVVGADTNSNCDSFMVDMTADAFFVTAGDTVQFSDLSNDPLNTIIGWEWDFGDGNFSSEQNPMYVYDTAGFYTVVLHILNSLGCVDSTFSFMIVAPKSGDTTGCSGLVADFEYTPATPNFMDTVIFTNLSVSPNGLIIATFWDFGDSASNMGANPTHVFDTIGSYNVTLMVMDINFCTDSVTKTIVVSDTGVSIYEYPVLNLFVIYPNPTTGKFVVDFKSTVKNVQPSKLIIYDVIGREVFVSNWGTGISRKEIDLAKLNGGVYTVELKSDYNTLQRSKLIISR